MVTFFRWLFEVELRLELGQGDVTPKDIYVDANESSLAIKVQQSGIIRTLMETSTLYEKIKPAETIWYIDEDQLRNINMLVGGINWEINQRIARELAVGLGYTPLSTEELLEAYAKQSMESWVNEEGSDVVAEAESATRGLSKPCPCCYCSRGKKGAAGRSKPMEASFLDSQYGFPFLKPQMKNLQKRRQKGICKIVVEDKDLPGKKSLYIRLGCRGDWPDIKPPGWDPSTSPDASPPSS
ncbi:hypothetical protein HAX54_009706 [Datura stramonium]|uniref:Uncharacterized protein n=1 Tax=Datura stramonium TaxID=4076 RepID=A0ABS8TGK8_DATST|nr:hypothetical protein [Datura stramonium]